MSTGTAKVLRRELAHELYAEEGQKFTHAELKEVYANEDFKKICRAKKKNLKPRNQVKPINVAPKDELDTVFSFRNRRHFWDVAMSKKQINH